MIKNKTVNKFLDSVASKDPTPGGGAVAALTGALATALVEMVLHLTKETRGMGLNAADLKVFRKKFLKLADDDVKAFDQVIKAYRTKDKKKIEKALKRAIEVPMETANLASRVAKKALLLSKKGNPNAYSDARSAYFLAQAAILSAKENIEINRKSLIAIHR